MIVYKCLNESGQSQYQYYRWPLPDGSVPGDWIECHDSRPTQLCQNGLHGWETLERAISQGQHFNVYEMELEGEIKSDGTKVCGRRARLLRLVHDRNGPVVLMGELVWQ